MDAEDENDQMTDEVVLNADDNRFNYSNENPIKKKDSSKYTDDYINN